MNNKKRCSKLFLGLDLSWCKSPDAGLPKPDKVFFFTLPLEHVQQRNGFGNER